MAESDNMEHSERILCHTVVMACYVSLLFFHGEIPDKIYLKKDLC